MSDRAMTDEGTDGLAAEVARLRRAASVLSGAAARMPSQDPGTLAFGADGPGRLGALGDQLHDQLTACLEARGNEAGLHAGRLDRLADALRRAAGGYADVDETARRRANDASAEGA